jgi:hypothetical protein
MWNKNSTSTAAFSGSAFTPTAACLSQGLGEQFAGPIGDFRLVVKIVVRLHKCAHPHHAYEPFPIAAQFRAGDRQRVHRALGRRILRKFDRHR